ncbi:DNA-3-methyladenine glycosylase I [Oceanibacterium hippocampi]|uniref:DNA-3-methyladenine glycosylase I n=1 Tax=Oceanibacterium hippocampi TaxID=745714 RepID=UPI001C380526|nr:DNA-3-methyladenine glycosylase I [Oceanibacterium hippocampi]
MPGRLAFRRIRAEAACRAGGRLRLAATLPDPRPAAALREVAERRWLALISRATFESGQSIEVVARKWPDFEAAFEGFDPDAVAAFDGARLDALAADEKLIRHAKKIRAVQRNARALIRLRARGGLALAVAEWPVRDITGLWHRLAAEFRFLGVASAALLLRRIGKDGFVPTPDLADALRYWSVVEIDGGDRPARPSQDILQALFNAWAADSGRPLCQVEAILLRSVAPPGPEGCACQCM